MPHTGKTQSPSSDALQLMTFDRTSVGEWLADIERAVEASNEDIRREYQNIGGENGLELFV